MTNALQYSPPISPSSQSDSASNKRTILVVSHNHPQFFPGGAEIFAYDLFNAIKTQGKYNAFFLAGVAGHSREMRPGTPFQTVGDASDEILFWGNLFDLFYQSQQNFHALYVEFKELISQVKPDIIHFHHTLRIGLEALQVVRNTLPDVKIVYTLHEFILMCHNGGQMITAQTKELCDFPSPDRCSKCFPDYTPQQFKMRELFIKSHIALVDHFISPSYFLANRFIEWGIPESKITVLENGRQLQSPAPFRTLPPGSSARNCFGYFGQVNPFKGILLVLKAVELLTKNGYDNFRLDIFGGVTNGFPEFKESFYEFIDKYQDNVSYHGEYKQSEIPELISLVDWAIVPSTWWENSPLVIQEVFMHKRPIICSNIGGMAEKVTDYETGLHFRVRNHVSLAQKMEIAINNPELWQKFVDNIQPRLSMEASVSQHLSLYEGI